MFPINVVNVEATNLGSAAKIVEESDIQYISEATIRELLSFYDFGNSSILDDMLSDFEKTSENMAAERAFEEARIKYLEKYSERKSKTSLRVPYIPQVPDMHMGCEIASLSMMLRKWGIRVSKGSIYRKLQSYRSKWTFNESPSIAYSEIKSYNPHSSRFSIIFPEQMVPIINEILKEKGRDDLIATAIYNYKMSDLDHFVSNYKAPVVIYGGYPIDDHGHVVLYVGNNIIRDPWTPYGSTRYFSRSSLWYAIRNGGYGDNNWHVTGQTYGFTIVKKADYEELKNFSTVKLGSQATKAQILQRKTKIEVSSGKKYKLDELYLVTREDGSVYVGYREKVEGNPTNYVYNPIDDNERFDINQKIESKEKLWEIFPKKLSSAQRKAGLTYEELYTIIEPLMTPKEKAINEDLMALIVGISENALIDGQMNVSAKIEEYVQGRIISEVKYHLNQNVVIPLEKYEIEIQEQELEKKKSTTKKKETEVKTKEVEKKTTKKQTTAKKSKKKTDAETKVVEKTATKKQTTTKKSKKKTDAEIKVVEEKPKKKSATGKQKKKTVGEKKP